MSGLVLLFILVLAASLLTVREVIQDRPRRPPRSRRVDPAFLPPSAWEP